MDATPTVSVAMSVYNNERYLREAIESILSQTFTDFEFLIIDDGSTDRSLNILQEYAAQDQRIRCHSRENRGIPKTRNEMLAQARGELIAVMDADDIALPDRFACQVEFLQTYPDVVCVGGAFERIDEKGRFIDRCQPPQTDAEIQPILLGGMSCLHHPCTMARRSAMLTVGGYDETMVGSSDLDLWLRLGEIGHLANLPDTVLRYRMHLNSLTYRRKVRQALDAQAACERAWKRRGIQGEFIREANDFMRQHEFLLRCGWGSFNRGERAMAIDWGLKAITIQPLNLDSWRLLVCAVIKPIPKPSSL
jgi:hypothetical protein